MGAFSNRTEAGERLGNALAARELGVDVVLAIPRGGLPLGRAVADALDAPLDVVVAQKMGAPHNSELAIGAVAADGSEWRNERVVDQYDVDDDHVARERERQAEAASEKARRYREGRDARSLEDRTVAIVDDGIATGATVRACIRKVESDGARRVVVAVPVASPRALSEIEDRVEAVVCLESPVDFRAVGQFYETFDQVSDEEAMEYL